MSEKAKSLLNMLVDHPPQPLTGTVKAVDLSAGTCDVEPNDGGADILGARLRAVLDGAAVGLLLVPAVGADVVLLPLDAHSYAVVLASELSEARVTIGARTWVMNGNGIVLNGGQKGGLPLVTPLVALLNNLITQVNTHSLSIGGTPLPPATESGLANPLIKQ